MNISQLKKIPVSAIVEKLGGEHVKSVSKTKECYTSPFRQETKGSFYVYNDNNKWHDFGHVGKNSGDGLDLITEYLKERGMPCEVSDGLSYAQDLFGGLKVEPLKNRSAKSVKENKIVIDHVRDELSPSTLNYVKGRGITDRGLIRNTLKQVHFHFEKNPDRKLYGVGFGSDKNGFEIRGKSKDNQIKYAAGEKDITTIKGEDNTRLSIFEGFFDYLTHMQREGFKSVPPTDTVVLNTATLVTRTVPLINQNKYESILFYRQNDEPGLKAMNILKKEFPETPIIDKSSMYKGHGDYNEMHMTLLSSQGMGIKRLA